MNAPRVEVHEDRPALATAIAGELLSRLADLQQAGVTPQIALTGGTIADAVHRELARLTPDSDVDWSRVGVWWGDERFVAPDSSDRNALQAREAFLDTVGADLHEMPSTASAGSAAEGAASYAADLREHGGGEFDVMMLGVGPDGHVASLFPGYPQLDVSAELAVAVADSPKPPPERISLTFAALNRSKVVWFLVSGEEKAIAVGRALATDPEGRPSADLHDIPAVGVTGTEETTWFLDRDSASLL